MPQAPAARRSLARTPWGMWAVLVVLVVVVVVALSNQPTTTTVIHHQYDGKAPVVTSTPPPAVVPSSGMRHVTGARHNADGSCTQSNGRRGYVRNGECFVPD